MFLHNFRQFLENWIFEGISTGADLTKMVKICIILNLCKEIIFWQNYLFHSSKEEFLHNFRQFLENWIFEGISTGADLTKMVKICIILICAKKIFFGKIIYSTHQKKCFSTILGNFWKIEFLKEYRQARTLQKWWKFVLSQFVLRKYFLAKLFVPLIKGRVSPQFYTIFGKLNFWRNIDRRGPYKNGEICIILICAKKIFFGKIIYSTHQKKCFSTILGNFWKIEFLKEYRQARTLQKWWKFVLSQFVLRKYFLAKLFVPLIKGSFLHNFRQFLENWIFEGISTGADLTKMVKICIISNCAEKIFFCKIFCSTHQKKCFSTMLRNFWKIEFLKEYRQART